MEKAKYSNLNEGIDFKIQREKTAEEQSAFFVAKTLQEKGFEAYFAGGCVRDELLGMPAHDIDIATSAKPEEIQEIFPENFEKGKVFGVIGVHNEGQKFEVATFRKDIGVFDHRRPEKVEYSSAEEDAERRDFTINGLFYDPVQEKIIDYVGGIEDIKGKVIKFIGNPKDRINEDYLRMLRAVRFSAKLNFMIEPKSKEAIREFAPKIKTISKERIREEITKILINQNRDLALKELDSMGFLKELLAELLTQKGVQQPPEFHSEGDVWTHTLLALKNAGENPSARLVWAILLHDSAKPETIAFRDEIGKSSVTFFEHDTKSAEKAKKILKRLKFSNDFINDVHWAISQHMRIIHAFQGMSERKQQKLFSDKNIDLLLDLTKADMSASIRPNGKADISTYFDAVKLKEKYEQETPDEEKKQVEKFDLITGTDIIQELNIEPGPAIGKIKSEIEQAFYDGKVNNRQEALELLESYRK